MRSVAAWGSRPQKVVNPEFGELNIHAELKAGIGIDYNPETKEILVATAFYANTEKFPFVKSETYKILNKKLDVGLPSTCLFKGTWNGDPSKVKTELFAGLTGLFRDSVTDLCGALVSGRSDIKRLKRIGRLGRGEVSISRLAVLGWLISNGAQGSVAWTKETLIPLLDKQEGFEEMAKAISLSVYKKVERVRRSLRSDP